MLSGPLTHDENPDGEPLLDSKGHRWRVILQPTISGGEYVFNNVTVKSLEDPPQTVTKAVLQWLPLQDLMRLDAERRRNVLAQLVEISEVEVVRTKARAELHEARATRKGGYLPDHWREIAKVYGNAENKPTEHVRHYLATVTGQDVSPSTAASHVWRARRYVDPETGKPYLEKKGDQ